MAFGDAIVEAVLGKVSFPEDTNNAPNTIAEGAAVNTTVGITAHSTFANGNASLDYTLSADSSGGGFKIDHNTGVVTVADPSKIDFESAPGHAYTITVLATKNNNFSAEQTFTISVTDIAPSTPVDSNAAANTVLEGAANGTTVGVTASSTDVNGGAVTYSLIGDTSGGGFTVNATTGVVTVADGSKIDFESAAGHAYTVTVQSSDGTLTSSQAFTINVGDVAMTTPVDNNGAANSVAEGAAAGTTVGITAQASDPSGPATTYSLIGDTSAGGFTINASTGVVTVANPAKIDFESSGAGHSYNITVQASNGVQTTSQVFTVGVTDVAPSAPTDSNGAANTVVEGAANGTVVGVTAASTDVNGGAVTYSLTGDTSGGGFTINSTTGVITVADSTKINYETAPGHAYTVTAQASDGTLTNSQTFTIAVSDLAPSAPVDSNGATNTVAEGAANGSTVGVTAFSTDVNGPGVTYSLVGDTSGGGFTINSTTGVITVADSTKLDYETGPAGHTYTVTAQASDGTLTNSQAFTIALTDVAPTAPVDTNAAANAVAEGAANGSTVGITASSVDPNGPATTYSLTDSAGGRFAIDSSTGIVAVANGAAIDFETAPGHAYGITVLATNGALNTSTAFSIGVTDVGPSAPADTDGTTNHVAEGMANGSLVGITASSTDPGGGPAPTYTLTDDAGGRFAINSTTGVVTVANGAAIDYETAPGHAYGITVQATAGALTNTQIFSIAVDNVNEAPVNTVPGTQTVNEDTPLVFSGNISVSDVDAAGGNETVTLTVGSGALTLNGTAGLAFTVGDGTGDATMTFSGTLAAINAALNGLAYQGNLNFNGSDTLTIISNDNGNSGSGAPESDTDSFTINVNAVNDAPVVTAGHTLNYTENQAATAFDPAITVSDVDSANLASATVQITGNYVNGQDVLGFTNQNGITGVFNAGTGTLTLTGSSSVANYQTALASVTYVNTSDNPSGLARTVTITTNDGALNSVAATDTINVTPVNDAPVVTAGHTLNYTENQVATAIDPAIAVSDVDSANLASATVQITGNYVNGEDVLGFTNQNGISGSFNAGTGTLTLSGSSSVANYQTALASVTYVNTSDNPSGAARTVTITTNDGALNSIAATDTINVTPVNDAPVATAGHTLAYTENDPATAIDSAITVSDVDSANLASATVQITGNYVNGQDVLSFTNQNGITGSFNAATGTLTLTGASSVANYQTALDSVKYSNTSDDPSTAARTVTIITNDGAANSVAVTDTITVAAVNDAPTLTATGNNPNYSNGVDLFSAVSASTVEAGQSLDQLKLTVTNISGTATDSLSIDGVTVALTNGNVVSTSTPGVTATVAVSGSTATVTIDSTPGLSNAAMAALVDGISYTDTNVNPGDPARVVTITQLHDTGGTSPGVDTTVLSITSTVSFDQAPVVTAGHTLNYTENQAATAFDTAITVTDADNANLASATVQITGGYVNGEDVLGFTNQNGITGSFNAATGTLTLTGSSSVANYQTALASVTYVNTSDNPSGAARTVTITANDGFVNSTPVTDTINVTPVNDAPVVTAGHTLNYTENQAATAFDPAIAVSDVDSANLASATVQITGNYASGQDVLGFTNQNGITGSFNAGTGTMTLTGSSSVANYQTALASVTYVNTSENPSGLARTVTIITNDGALNSVAKTDTINVTPVNDAPVTTAGGTLNYTENQAATAIDATVTVSDVDNANLSSATVQLTTNYVNGQDILGFTTQNGITGVFSAATGTMTLSGSSSVANYQTALRSVTYFDNSDNPSGLDRTVVYTANDGALNSNSSTSTIHVTPVNDAPVVTATGTLAYTENQVATAIAPALTVTDVDTATLTTATVQISANYVSGEDVLAFTTQNGITGVFNAGTGTMTLTGTASVANYQTAMESVTYVNTSENPSTAARTVTFNADDGQAANHLSTGSNHTITVASVDDAPVNNGVPGPFTVMSGFTHAITGLSISDVDAGSGNNITTTLTSAGGGSVTVGAVGGGAAITGNSSGAVTLTGTIGQINTSLGGSVVYTAADNVTTSSLTTLTIATNDQGHTGTGGPLTDTDIVSVGVTPQVWFIDQAQTGLVATEPRGSQLNPFSDISEFNTASLTSTGPGNNDTIYIKAGTYTGPGINLKDGQTLLGDDQALSLADPFGGPAIVIETSSGARPTINVTTGGDQAIDLGVGNTIHGINITTAAGTTGLDDGQGAGGNAVGSLTVDQMQISGAGQAVDIDQGGALSVSLESLSSSGGAEGIQLAGTASSGAGLLSGTFSVGGTGAISGSTTAGIMVGDGGTTASAGGTVAITYNGTVTTTGTAHAVDIQDRVAGAGNIGLGGTISHASGNGSSIFLDQNAAGTVTFSGANSVLNSGTTDAVHITNNGATVNFTGGGLNIDATSGAGFLASGGGTVSVTGSNNSINTGTGTALNISNTTIGASGVTFHDISANGGTNGIVLVNTGGGPFTVTGDGTNTAQGGNSSGGIIQNLTGADGTTQLNGASNGIGIGVYVSNASNVTIQRMNIHDASNFGVDVEGSSNFVMKYTTVGGVNGSNAGQEESSVRLLELGGTNTLDNNDISGGFTDNVRLDNHTAALLDLIVTNNKIHDNNATSGNQGILVDFVTGAAQTLHFTGNTFSHNRAESVFIGASGGATSNTAVINATVTNNTFTGNRSTDLGGGFEIQTANFNGHLLYDISGNTLQPVISGSNFAVNQGSAIQVSAAGSASSLVEGRINNNKIGTTGVAFSGTQQGSGITVDNTGSGTHTTLITNNDVQHFGNTGIAMTVGGAGLTTGTFNATITGNTVHNTDATAAGSGTPNGINGNFGTNTGNAETINLDISGNTLGGGGSNDAIGAEDFRLRQRMNTDVFIKGYGGGSGVNDTASVVSYIQSVNTGSETGTATVSLASPPHGFHGIGSVPQPTLPPPLRAAAGGVQASSPTPGETHLSQAQLDSVVAAAIAQWAHAGASAAQLAALAAITFTVTDLSGDIIGEQTPGHITIDTNAAGHGWFVDATPNDNSEFTHAANAEGTDLYTDPSNAAAGHLDLLTAVTHEMGHVLGLDDETAASSAHDLMFIDLVDGERRLPDATDVVQADATKAIDAAEAAVPVSAQAAAGTPMIVGTSGNDTIDAGHGGNILFGGAGADNFVFGPGIQLNAPTPAQITHVADYSAAHGDTFDFSALTSAFHNSGVSDALVVRAVEDASGKFAMLQVDHIDPMGLPSAPNWVNVAQLDGAHAGDSVNVLIDNNHSVHLAQIHVDLLV